MDSIRAHTRRELVFFALASMEACVVAPLITAIISRITPLQPSPLLITGIFLGALLTVHYIARASLQFPFHPILRSCLLGLGMLLSGLLLVHQLLHAQTSLWNPAWLADAFRNLQTDELLSLDVVVFLLALFIWWRGIVLAQRRLESDTVVSRFRSGMVMLAITTMVSGFLLPSAPYQFVFVFFFVSLLGIALARAEEVGQQYGGSQSPFSLSWLATVVTATIGILILAAGFATLLTDKNVSRFLGPVWEVQRIVFTFLTYVILFVVSWVGRGVIEFLESIMGDLDTKGFEFALTPPEIGGVEALGESSFTPEQQALAKAVGVIFTILIILLLIAFSLRRLRARAGRRRNEYRESVWEGINVRNSLRDLLNDGRRRLGEMTNMLSHSRLGQMFAALTIRRIYAHMSALATELGHPRALYETPYEYQPTLEQAFPNNHEEVGQVTEAYVTVHYGEVPDQHTNLKMIRAAWERIQEAALKNSH
jgi:hypothetical protein